MKLLLCLLSLVPIIGFSATPVLARPSGCCVLEREVNPGQACNILIACVCKQQTPPFQEKHYWGNALARNQISRRIVGFQDAGDCTPPSVWIPSGSEPCAQECIEFTCPFSNVCQGTFWTWESCTSSMFLTICTTGVPQDYCLESTVCDPGLCPYLY